MTRAHLSKPILDSAGNVRTGAIVRVLQPGTTTPITDVLYAAGMGSATRTNSFVATNGVVDFYLDVPSRVRLGVTVGQEGETFFEDVDVLEPATPSTGPSAPDFGSSLANPFPATGFYIRDAVDAQTWLVTIDSTGHLTTAVATA